MGGWRRFQVSTATALLSLVTLLGATGCFEQECDQDGASRCNGNRAEVCSDHNDPEEARWLGEECGDLTCVMSGDTAMCATSSGPDPRCDAGMTSPTSGARQFCDENTIFSCTVDGYAVPAKTCGWEEYDGAARHCVSANDEVFCAESVEPDPACDGASSPVCSGGDVAGCRLGYRVSHVTCVGACIPDEVPFCALDAEPYEGCQDASICAAGTLVDCHHGYRVSESACDSGHCETSELRPVCTLAAEPDPLCPQTGASELCDGTALVGCLNGYVVSHEYLSSTCKKGR